MHSADDQSNIPQLAACGASGSGTERRTRTRFGLLLVARADEKFRVPMRPWECLRKLRARENFRKEYLANATATPPRHPPRELPTERISESAAFIASRLTRRGLRDNRGELLRQRCHPDARH